MRKKWLKALAIISVSFLLIFSGAALSSHVEQAQARSRTKYVYIAPRNGKKYHARRTCRGLRRARYVKRVTITYAKRHHYTRCKICY